MSSTKRAALYVRVSTDAQNREKGILAASPTRWMRRWKPIGLIGPPRSETNTVAAQLRQRPHLFTADRMYAGNAVLDPVNVQAAFG